MQIQVGFDNIGLNRVIRHPIKKTERMNKACIAAIHRLQLKAPLEAIRRTWERTLESQRDLIEQWLVRPIVKHPAKVLPVVRLVEVGGETALNPAINLEQIFALGRGHNRFTRPGDIGQADRTQ